MRNLPRDSARAYAGTLSVAPELQLLRMLFIMPPATLIRDMAEAASDPKIMVGAQSFHWAEHGEFTGELSIGLLKQEGARIVLVGHAERRLLFGETDEIIKKKIHRASSDGLMVVLCVGDVEVEADSSAVRDFLQRQLLAALGDANAELLNRLILAYEPIWAIGRAVSIGRLTRSSRSKYRSASRRFKHLARCPRYTNSLRRQCEP